MLKATYEKLIQLYYNFLNTPSYTQKAIALFLVVLAIALAYQSVWFDAILAAICAFLFLAVAANN